MSKKISKKEQKEALIAEKSEASMIDGIIEGSPDAIGVVVVRLECGCRKMAAVDKKGDPASKVIAYRDNAMSICDQCKEDHGDFMRVTESFIHWIEPAPSQDDQDMINAKVLGTTPVTN
ncbi:MAG: hypothetical protein H8E79_07670 [Desulfobulbaceae bacterium]|uniref:Uncharacterized protein n=1 Tax=Candidatus Desulfatifera sulfidica TaxID=2841691 RepID=A0A8J6NBC5_9BACT|nr:hypothetical protein [Candidatus Desulfatifera sulfidica]